MTEYELIQKTEELINLFGTKDLTKAQHLIDSYPILMEKNPSSHGYDILGWVCFNNYLEGVKILIENKINTQIIGTLNHHPLSIVAEKNNINILEYFLKLNIYDINVINKALEDAIFFEKYKSADLLIEMGGDINNDNCSILKLLCVMDKYEAIEYMVSLNCMIPEDLVLNNKKMADVINYYRNNQKLNEQLNQDLPHQESIKNQLKI